MRLNQTFKVWGAALAALFSVHVFSQESIERVPRKSSYYEPPQWFSAMATPEKQPYIHDPEQFSLENLLKASSHVGKFVKSNPRYPCRKTDHLGEKVWSFCEMP